jgi:tetratricopeptide (TPR) repeat protein
MRLSQGRLIWILLAAAVVLLVVAVVAGVVYAILQRQQPVASAWQDPIAGIVPDETAAALAVYPLAGASELETIDVSLSSGELETAYAVLVFSMDLSDVQRIGRLTLLGGKFAEAEQAERAALCYQQIYDVALASPRLSDPLRADALLGSGAGWAGIGRKTEALMANDQVYLLAVQSPYLQMAQRRDLLSVLERAYRDLGDLEQAAACEQQIVNLDQQVNPQPPAIPVPLPDLPQGTEPVSSPEVGILEETRRQAAFALLQALPGEESPPSELVGNLAQALRAEDVAKLDLYQQQLEATSQSGKRINIHWHLIRWLVLKYQVAAKGFGVSLVPEWEAQLPEIQSALSKAYEGLYFDYEDLVTALPEASLIAPGSYLVRREVILAGRLGQYPNYPAEQMADKLQDAVAAMIAAGSREQLYLDVAVEDGGLRFYLSPADRYGQPAQSP